MNLYRSVRAVTSSASGTGTIDWDAVAEAAKSSTPPGSVSLTAAERDGYARDVRDARKRIRTVAEVEFDLPDTVEVQNRHHWIDANIRTFRRVMRPLEENAPEMFPGAARAINTGTMAFMLSFLGKNVLGQYDPLLLAEGDAGADTDHGLYFVHPNIKRVSGLLDVDEERFRRWIAFHEVSHAAEFGAAPWLSDHLETRMKSGIEALTSGELDMAAFKELDTAMTAVEGYAELLMDRTFDEEYTDLREKLDERRRQGGGPVGRLVRRLLGLGLKRRQYERGSAFFEAVADERGLAAAGAVWERPENLPTDAELNDPRKWLVRVDP